MNLSFLQQVYAAILVILQFSSIGYLLYKEPIFTSGSFLALQVIALVLASAGVFSLEPGKFNIRPIPKEGTKLHTHGAYRFIRHPMYAAILLFFAPITVLTLHPLVWGAYAILAATLLAKLHFEETLLTDKFPEYTSYQKNSKKLIPFIY